MLARWSNDEKWNSSGLLQRIPLGLGLGSSLGLGLDLEIEGVQWAMDMDLEDMELLKLVPLAGFVCLCYCLSLCFNSCA